MSAQAAAILPEDLAKLRITTGRGLVRCELRLVACPSVNSIRRQEMANQAGFPCSQYLSLVVENVLPHIALKYGIALKGGARQVRRGDSEHIAFDLRWFTYVVRSSTACLPRALWLLAELALLCHADDPDYRAKLV